MAEANNEPTIRILEDLPLVKSDTVGGYVVDGMSLRKDSKSAQGLCFLIFFEGAKGQSYPRMQMVTETTVAWPPRISVEDFKKGEAVYRQKSKKCSMTISINSETGGKALNAIRAIQNTVLLEAFMNRTLWFGPTGEEAYDTVKRMRAIAFKTGMVLQEAKEGKDGATYDPMLATKIVGWNWWCMNAELAVGASGKEYVKSVKWAPRVVGGTFTDEEGKTVEDKGPAAHHDTCFLLCVGYKNGVPKYVRQVAMYDEAGAPLMDASNTPIRRWVGPQDVQRNMVVLTSVLTPTKGYVVQGAGITVQHDEVYLMPLAPHAVANAKGVDVSDFEMDDICALYPSPASNSGVAAGAGAEDGVSASPVADKSGTNLATVTTSSPLPATNGTTPAVTPDMSAAAAELNALLNGDMTTVLQGVPSASNEGAEATTVDAVVEAQTTTTTVEASVESVSNVSPGVAPLTTSPAVTTSGSKRSRAAAARASASDAVDVPMPRSPTNKRAHTSDAF